MSTLVTVWPQLGTAVTLADGVTVIDEDGAVVTYTQEIRNLLRAGQLLDYDPRLEPNTDPDVPPSGLAVRYVTEPGTSHAFVLSDAYKTILCTNPAAIALQIPANAAVPYEVGTVFAFIPMDTGQITLSGAAGVTVVSGGNEFKSLRQLGPLFAQQTSANTWLVSGEKSP